MNKVIKFHDIWHGQEFLIGDTVYVKAAETIHRMAGPCRDCGSDKFNVIRLDKDNYSHFCGISHVEPITPASKVDTHLCFLRDLPIAGPFVRLYAKLAAGDTVDTFDIAFGEIPALVGKLRAAYYAEIEEELPW